jgi:hypothetical protein
MVDAGQPSNLETLLGNGVCSAEGLDATGFGLAAYTSHLGQA